VEWNIKLQRMRPITSLFGSRKLCLRTVVAIFIVSRCLYYWMGVRFETSPLLHYWQGIDPVLLRDELWQSLFYLRDQLPGLNLYIGITMHLFPRHSVAAFHATYLGLGLMLAICLFLLLDRLRVSRPIAVLITVVCVISPVTVLYENWLFYEYPLAVLFYVSALFLHRYASSHQRIDGIVFFTSLALIGLLRVIYHLIWFWMIVALVIYALPRCRRRTLLCAAAPGVLLIMIYLKSLILFGLWMPGSDNFGAINLAYLSVARLPRHIVAEMAVKGTISPIMLHSFEDEELVHVVAVPPRTGIRILDERLKSTGAINMHSLWMAAIGRQLRQDGLAVLRIHPKAALRTVRRNVVIYFLPADVGWPYGQISPPNQQVLSTLLKTFDLVMAGKHPAYNHAFISYVTISFLFWFGIWRSARWLKRVIRRPSGNARDLTIVFAFGNIAYLTAVIILYAYAEQNRILFEVFPLFIILLGSLIVFVTWRFRVSQSGILRYSKGRE
jgi:hypothetical protein